ncbi:MAG: hypothetical protein VKK05_08020 [Synechococcus sp.]|nr:hypothetical protein [Synechococcus sp.]
MTDPTNGIGDRIIEAAVFAVQLAVRFEIGVDETEASLGGSQA